MNLCRGLLFALAVAGLGASVVAQGSVRVVGGGCPNRQAVSVSGPLTLGSTMRIDTGCISSPGTTKFLLIGLALPQASWVTLRLQTSISGYDLCDVSVVPVIVGADVSAGPDPLPVPIPNDPVWTGFPLALQSYCIECGFAGCYATLTQGVEVTIQ